MLFLIILISLMAYVLLILISHFYPRNEKYLDDYSVIIAHFKLKHCDVKNSPTSVLTKSLLSPRAALIRIKSPVSDTDKTGFKIKIKSNAGFFVIDNKHIRIDGNEAETGGDVPNNTTSDEHYTSFWSSCLFFQGVERFMKHLEYVRHQGSPRLVDLGPQNEEDNNVAKSSLIELPQLIQLCKVVRTVNRASLSSQTTMVE